MITHLRKYVSYAVSTMLLLMFAAGCAQTRATVKEENSAPLGSGSTGVINAIKVSEDASQVEVMADKPLSYTYYKTTEPPRVVIDIAQTEPGPAAKPIEVNAGNIKRIDVAKHEFTGGFLSRIEISLSKEGGDYTVATDAADKGKLVVTFPKAPGEEKPATVAKEETKAVPAPESEIKPTEPPLQAEAQAVKEEAKATPVATSESKQGETPPQAAPLAKEEAKPAPAAAKAEQKTEVVAVAEKGEGNKGGAAEVKKEAQPDPGKKAQPAEQKRLTAVSATDAGVEIRVTGGVESFKAFKLIKPDRLVLDLPGIKSGITGKTVPINKLNLSQARIGTYPDKVRVVLDAAKETLPPYQVTKSADGLKVVFTGAPAPPSAAGATEPPREKAPQSAAAATKGGASAIEAIDFQTVGAYSQIAIRIGGACSAGKMAKVAGGLSLTIRNCQVPGKFQRMMDTSAFPGAVQKVTPYQVKVKQGYEARIQVKLRQAVADTYLKQEGNTLYWNIRNPQSAKAPVAARPLPAATETATAPVPPQRGSQAATSEVAVGTQVAAAPKAGERKVYTGRRVSLEFSDADIRKILQLIAEVSNLNFLIGDDVTGTLSIKLVNVPWDQALDVILDAKGLEKRQEGNIMYIKPKGKFKTEEQEEAEAKKERERRMELKTKVFDINFAAVADIATQFDKLKSDRGTISQDARTNRVIVTDIDDRIEKMRDLLKVLDQPEKQVMIEARIVEATSTFTRDLGVQWGLHYQDADGQFLGIRSTDVGLGGIVINAPTSGTFSDTSSTTTGGAAGISFGRLASNVQLDLRLSAAASVGQIKVISTPKVITLNNKAAKISQGQSIPYQTTSAEGTKTEFVEAALTLEVTPHVANDGTISMKIKASNNSAGNGSPPPINKKEATTEVQVLNGETTVIGGIYQDSDTEQDDGVPVLMDVPLLGWLFKSNSKKKVKTELLIFITPKLVI